MLSETPTNKEKGTLYLAIEPPNEESVVTEIPIGNTTPLPNTDDPMEKKGHKTRMCPHQIAKSRLQKRVRRRLDLMPRNRNTTSILINPSYVLETIGHFRNGYAIGTTLHCRLFLEARSLPRMNHIAKRPRRSAAGSNYLFVLKLR